MHYECTAEESDEEWKDADRDDDATSKDPEERRRQKHAARSALLPGHKSLLTTPSSYRKLVGVGVGEGCVLSLD